MIGVDVVEADRGVTDAGLAFLGRGDIDVFPFQDFGAAGLVDANCFCHVPVSSK